MLTFDLLIKTAKTSPLHQITQPAPGISLTVANFGHPIGSGQFHGLCAAAGALACGLPHFGVTWLDMVKCRLQTNPSKYRNPIFGWQLSVREGGLRSLMRGWSPTLIGYSAQGAVKFGLYEVFKLGLVAAVGEDSAHRNRTLVYMAAAGSAEVFATSVLAPWEAAKIRIQTHNSAPNLRTAMPLMWRQEGLGAFYKGFVPLLGRQLPYTMVKFAAFERVNEIMYRFIVPKKRDDCTQIQQLGVTFVSGYIAGIAAVFCGLVFHPPDVILSNLHQAPHTNIRNLVTKLGYDGMWRASFIRVFMVGSMPTALQWCIYDTTRTHWLIQRTIPQQQMSMSLTAKLRVTENLNEHNIFVGNYFSNNIEQDN